MTTSARGPTGCPSSCSRRRQAALRPGRREAHRGARLQRHRGDARHRSRASGRPRRVRRPRRGARVGPSGAGKKLEHRPSSPPRSGVRQRVRRRRHAPARPRDPAEPAGRGGLRRDDLVHAGAGADVAGDPGDHHREARARRQRTRRPPRLGAGVRRRALRPPAARGRVPPGRATRSARTPRCRPRRRRGRRPRRRGDRARQPRQGHGGRRRSSRRTSPSVCPRPRASAWTESHRERARTSRAGFRAPARRRAAGARRSRASGKPDVALVVNDGPDAAAAAVFTSNRAQGEPDHLVAAGRRGRRRSRRRPELRRRELLHRRRSASRPRT